MEPRVRNAIFQALERVEERAKTFGRTQAEMPNLKDNTPLRTFFRLMADMPATVFSITFPNEGQRPIG
jgi:hypothetical protein